MASSVWHTDLYVYLTFKNLLNHDYCCLCISVLGEALFAICCMHASMPPKRTSRRLGGHPPKSQERVEVGSADEEASPPPGSAMVDYARAQPGQDKRLFSLSVVPQHFLPRPKSRTLALQGQVSM